MTDVGVSFSNHRLRRSTVEKTPRNRLRKDSLLPGLVTVSALFLVFVSTQAFSETHRLAFPTAEGYGRFAKGGRGGDVYRVTTLEDNGPGSLRHGIQTAEGPRTIVFDLSGTIELATPLVIDKSVLTIAGQTAMAGGITLKHGT
jgi:hypothetical protein